ncbi:MAG TPA: family 16 glycoside hydrolase [Verrucomicrobiae bacterium]|jgi:hypothetical protein|nr:family 16 glycoside hydrolase [Verrucomicrobiae bacterium]
MQRLIVGLVALLLAAPLWAAEQSFNFSDMPTNLPPTNCTSIVGGEGKPGNWKVVLDEVPLPIAPINPGAPKTGSQAVVGQFAWEATDEHFPMLVLGKDTYANFTFTTRFKIVDGLTEQMAGVAFRLQDERNYYYVRASALGNTFYFYTVTKGVRSNPIGNQMTIEKGVWHTLSIQCEGAKIRILLDGKEALPELTDPTYSSGKIALWTKSDSISYFTDMRVNYTPREPFAQSMVRDAMKEFSTKLLGLQIVAVPPDAKDARMIASTDEKEIGKPGEATDLDVINKNVNYYLRDKGAVYVTMPLRDRNGDTVAAVRFAMKTFPGQTEDNALERATPILKALQLRASSVDKLY